MITVSSPPEPPNFDAQARQPGNRWLANHPEAKRPRDYWSSFKGDLANGFNHLCGYSAMYEPIGTVDHYLSCENYPHLAYEWSNYRYAAQWINSSKRTLDEQILDPWYQLYLDRDLTLTGLETKAPLIARAIRKQQQSNKAENQ